MSNNWAACWRRHPWARIFVYTAVVTIFINEHLVYFLQAHRWVTMPEINRSGSEVQVLLLVADPQLQGYQDEHTPPIGSLARWDIDRYLSKTFSYAYDHVHPDVVLFLGDLMDEGSKATPAEYSETLHRFQATFHTHSYVKHIYIPGDNDIGGEGRDFVTQQKKDRFEQHFQSIVDIIKHNFIDYIKLDLHAHRLTEDKVTAADDMNQKHMSPLTVVVNHETLMSGPKHFIYPITKRLRPNLILSAHWHKAGIYTCDDCLREDEFSWTVHHQDLDYINSFLTIDLSLSEQMIEVAVPTCSYRMGVSNMGYGVLILESSGKMQFTVLWLPRRYTMLLGYLVVFLIFSIVYSVSNCGRRPRGI